MPATTEPLLLSELVKELRNARGFIQNSPIRTGVWHNYIANPKHPQAVLLIPLRSASAGDLCMHVNNLLIERGRADVCIYNQNTVSGSFTLLELITLVLPYSNWWQRNIEPHLDLLIALAGPKKKLPAGIDLDAVLRDLAETRASGRESGLAASILWCIRMLGIVTRAEDAKNAEELPTPVAQIRYAASYFKKIQEIFPTGAEAKLFAISRNREVAPCLINSVRSVKADATRELFDVRCNRLTWAVLDTGIDRNHPAFADINGNSRVKMSLDFTQLGEILQLAGSAQEADRLTLEQNFKLTPQQAKDLILNVRNGKPVDWSLLQDVLLVDPNNIGYFDSLAPHGTQVAGILAAQAHEAPAARIGEQRHTQPSGICPDINLVDMRVIKTGADRELAEFQIMSALQFIEFFNRDKDKPQILGANLSLSLPHSVYDYGCGQTPICVECDRLVSSGVVVVAAAGNYGFDDTDFGGPAQDGGYRDLSITDPGNADSVITVGATHSKYPHRYGVSYFSSRGPTGDGRLKPDLVAPGEAVYCPSKNKTYDRCDGTSMAAPHVSGAAALLMARNGGLIGQPQRIKHILCETATDLNRGADGQGCGLVDTLRAMQSL